MSRISGIDIALARKVLQTEADAILALIDRLCTNASQTKPASTIASKKRFVSCSTAAVAYL